VEINIYVQTKNIEFDYEKIVESVKEAFTSEFADDKLLSLILVNNEEIKEINKKYRNINKTTDVISFVDREDDYIGDIFICIDKVKEQAIKYKNSEEFCLQAESTQMYIPNIKKKIRCNSLYSEIVFIKIKHPVKNLSRKQLFIC